MSFMDKFNMLLNEFNVTNIEFATKSHINSTLISKYRNGKRIPSKNSDTVKKISKTFLEIAENKNMKTILLKKCKTLDIFSYFNADLSEKIFSPKENHTTFGANLTKIMNILNLTNATLALKIPIDPSLISKYRNGIRKPAINTALTKRLINYLAMTTVQDEKITVISNLLKIDLSKKSLGEIELSISNYLFNDTDTYHIEFEKTKEFLETIENLKLNTNTLNFDIQNLISKTTYKNHSNLYIGEKGLQESVIRFLSNVISKKRESDILLFSNQNISWMSKDVTFSKIWSMLMIYTLLGNNKIKIIHTLNRNADELFSALSKWMPLYLTGLIEGYYNTYSDELFSNTIFLEQDFGLYGSTLKGNEKNAIYHYTNEIKELNTIKKQFDKLFRNSKTLIKSYMNFNDYYEIINNSKEVTSLLTGLSFATMSKSLLIKILKRNKIKNSKKIIEIYNSLKVTNTTVMDEHLYIPKYHNNIKINIPIYLLNKDIYYTKEEYKEHLTNIEHLKNKNSNYNLTILDKQIYKNLEIIIIKNKCALIVKTDEPHIVFCFEHINLIKNLKKYIEFLSEN